MPPTAAPTAPPSPLPAAASPAAEAASAQQTTAAARRSTSTSAFVSSWPACCAAYPDLSSIAVSPASPAPSVASFCGAYAHASATLSSARDRPALRSDSQGSWLASMTP